MPEPNQKRKGGIWAVIASCLLVTAMMMPGSANALESAGSEGTSSEVSEAAGAAAKPEPLELVKVSPEGQKIVLGPLPDADGAFTGHLTVLVVNNNEKTERLALRYLQDAGPQSNPMASNTTGPVRMNGSPTAVKLQPGSPTPIRLAFELPKGKTASWLAGKLLISGTSKGGKTGPGSLVLPLSAEFQPLQEIVVNPPAETIQVTRGLSSATSPHVELTGPGAGALLERRPPFSAQVLLGDGAGHHVRATLDDLKESNGAVQGTLTLSDDASPGEYTGNLVLGAGTGAPELHLTVKSHIFILWFILLVLVSSLLGGLLPKLTRLGSRRALMRLTLRNAIKSYERELKAPDFIEGVPWDMKQRMGSKPWLGLRWNAVPGSQGYAGLYAQLRWARSEGELDDLGAKVTAAVSDISCWIELRGPATCLRKLREQPVLDRNGTPWKETFVARDTVDLLRELADDPPDTLDKCSAMKVRCGKQIAWHKEVMDAWTVITKAQTSETLTAGQRTKLTALDFGPIVNGAREVTRTSDETDQLEIKLSTLAAEARAIDLNLPQLLVQNESVDSPDPARKSIATFASERTRGSAKLADTEGRSTEHTLLTVLFTDWAVTLIVAVGSVLFYVTPLWTSTWGTLTDVLTAAAVGFGTQIVVQWGALPLLQPLFSKPSAPPPPAAS